MAIQNNPFWGAVLAALFSVSALADTVVYSDGVSTVWRASGVQDRQLPGWLDRVPEFRPRPVPADVHRFDVSSGSWRIVAKPRLLRRDCPPVFVDGRSVGGNSC